MTATLVSLGDEKDKRRGRCEYCNAEEHPQPLMCPRICAVTYDQDDNTVTLLFRPEWEPPLAG